MTTTPGGVFRDMPLLDLSHAAEPDDLAHIREICNVAVVVVPEHLAHLLGAITMRRVANVIRVRQGARVHAHTGSLMIGGDGLADPGGDNEVLIVTGVLIVTSPVKNVGFRQVHTTGMVLAPRGSESALGAGLTGVTGSVVYYRLGEAQEFRQLTGDVRLSGAAVANPHGSPEDVLITSGRLVVTSDVTDVGYQLIAFGGELLAPRRSETLLTPVLSGGGEIAWYDGQPRFLVGDETYGRAFFELLDDGEQLAFAGEVTIADDGVTPELVRQKVSQITLLGELRAPRDVVPVLQILTTEKCGTITVNRDGAEGQ
ncbi:MAG TPA: hypothetical protein VF053_07260 [Streptosporangiales bacterium]